MEAITIKQAEKDCKEYDEYIKSLDKIIVPKSFKDMFGYEILLSPLRFEGERHERN